MHFLLKALQHLLQLQVMLAGQLGLVPVLLFLKQTQLPQLLAPVGLKWRRSSGTEDQFSLYCQGRQSLEAKKREGETRSTIHTKITTVTECS